MFQTLEGGGRIVHDGRWSSYRVWGRAKGMHYKMRCDSLILPCDRPIVTEAGGTLIKSRWEGGPVRGSVG